MDAVTELIMVCDSVDIIFEHEVPGKCRLKLQNISHGLVACEIRTSSRAWRTSPINGLLLPGQSVVVTICHSGKIHEDRNRNCLWIEARMTSEKQVDSLLEEYADKSTLNLEGTTEESKASIL